MPIVNLTPHAISTADADGNLLATYEPSGSLARCAVSSETVATVDGVAIRRTVFGEVTGIPAAQDGVLYLTSTLVAQAAKRADVVSPDTGPTAVRKDGHVIAVKGFQTF